MHRIARENAIVQCKQDTLGEPELKIGTIPGRHEGSSGVEDAESIVSLLAALRSALSVDAVARRAAGEPRERRSRHARGDGGRAETAGERASFAQAFCDVSPERVGAYKERLRKVLTDPTNFDQHWDTGWHRAETTNSQMNALRERDPKEFAARIKVNCERLKWMAGNALRPPAQK
jgi:hypothetical protein